MKYYYVAPDRDVDGIYSSGVDMKGNPKIPIIALHESFLMTKYIMDVYAHDVLEVDVYCAFEVSHQGIQTPLFESQIQHIFKDVFKVVLQESIERKYLKPYKTDTSYEGMGLIDGVFPVENRDKFTGAYKEKILEYIKELGE
jgi:hypothetical protein